MTGSDATCRRKGSDALFHVRQEREPLFARFHARAEASINKEMASGSYSSWSCTTKATAMSRRIGTGIPFENRESSAMPSVFPSQSKMRSMSLTSFASNCAKAANSCVSANRTDAGDISFGYWGRLSARRDGGLVDRNSYLEHGRIDGLTKEQQVASFADKSRRRPGINVILMNIFAGVYV